MKQGKLSEAERLVGEAQRRVGRGDVWTRASILHALGVVRAAQGRTDEAEGRVHRGARGHRADDVRDPRAGRPRVARFAALAGARPGAAVSRDLVPQGPGPMSAATYHGTVERKVATVLFVDLVDSTGLVVGADPEVVRQRVNRYFEQVSRCIESHGGTVEKFAGDAVMAAFGVPLAHEDDAERALRAALAVLPAVESLGLAVRIGVESGEVVVEDAQSTFATGQAVNVAARLQQAAQPGEILLGPAARRLAAGAVEMESAGQVEVRGQTQPVWAWRALRALETRRRLRSTPFVGRESELELLEHMYARAVRDRRAHLVTVFGEPGVGKSRLVRELTQGWDRATVLFGRALPYGEGVTYFPLASMVKTSAGISDDDSSGEAVEKLRTCCKSEAVAELLAVALGVRAEHADGSGKELRWAARRWAEQLAEVQPLVLVFEDVHWAEEQLLDLLEDIARELRTGPMLIVAVARPELLEHRPTWAGGNPRALAVELGPLEADEAADLADALLERAEVPPAQRALLLEKAEGNPLFLEETARILTEEETALERIPDTVQALIAARIDRLDPAEKRLLQHAALAGRVFWRGALDHLSRRGRRGHARPPARSRADPAGGALDDHGRARVPLQARADPRCRVLGAEQGAPGRRSPKLRRLARRARSGRARGAAGVPPR